MLSRSRTRIANKPCICKEDKTERMIKCNTKNIDNCPGKGYYHSSCARAEDPENYICPICTEANREPLEIDENSSQDTEVNMDEPDFSFIDQNEEEHEGEELNLDYFKKEIEVIRSHHFQRLDKRDSNKIFTTFKVKWKGYDYVSYDEWKFLIRLGATSKTKLGEYIKNLPPRPKNTLLKRVPQLMSLIAE